MKRLLLFLLVFLMMSPVLAEDIDLNQMTTEELMALKTRINEILLQRTDVWKEISVPKGLWEIGKDIPAGHWTIRFCDSDGLQTVYITVGTRAHPLTGRVFENSEAYGLTNEKKATALSSPSQMDIELQNGMWLRVSNDYVLFFPFNAVRDLGFDW